MSTSGAKEDDGWREMLVKSAWLATRDMPMPRRRASTPFSSTPREGAAEERSRVDFDFDDAGKKRCLSASVSRGESEL